MTESDNKFKKKNKKKNLTHVLCSEKNSKGSNLQKKKPSSVAVSP